MSKINDIKEDNNRFVKIREEDLDNEVFRIIGRTSPYIVLARLIQYTVRKPFVGDLDLYEKYYKKGLLASSITTRKLTKDFGYSETSTKPIRKMIDCLEKIGWLKKEPLSQSDRSQMVYILGTHGNTEPGMYENNYWYYIDTLPTLDINMFKGIVRNS